MEAISTLLIEGKLTHPMDLICCKFTKDCDQILTGCADGMLRKVNCINLTMSGLYYDKQVENSDSPVTSIKFSPFSEACLTTYAEGFVKYWNINNAECMRTIEENNQILGCGVSPLQHIFATTADNAKLSIYDLETGSLTRTLESSYKPISDGHKSRVFAAKFHPINANELVSGGWDNTVQFWDLRQPTAIRFIFGPHICGDSIDIDSTGTELLTCSFADQNNLCIWNYNTAELLRDLTCDRSKNYCGAYLGNDHIITAGSSPSILRIIELKNGSVQATYSTPLKGLYGMDFCAPKTPKAPLAIKVITIASEILIKMKYIYRRESTLLENIINL